MLEEVELLGVVELLGAVVLEAGSTSIEEMALGANDADGAFVDVEFPGDVELAELVEFDGGVVEAGPVEFEGEPGSDESSSSGRTTM